MDGFGLLIVDCGLWIAECGFRVWDWLPKPSITRLEAFRDTFLVRLVVWVVSAAVRGL